MRCPLKLTPEKRGYNQLAGCYLICLEKYGVPMVLQGPETFLGQTAQHGPSDPGKPPQDTEGGKRHHISHGLST